MIGITVEDQLRLFTFWLCLAKWLGIIFHFPMLEGEEIPVSTKILAGLVITYAFFPFTEGTVVRDIQLVGREHFWILTFFYSIIGLGIGLMVKLIMNIFMGAGILITQTIGLTAIRYFDPSYAQAVGPFEKLIQFSMVIILIGSGALLPMFKGALLSFDQFSMSNFSTAQFNIEFFLSFFKHLFLMSLLLAGPLVMTNFMITLVMGIIARMVPQMNILLVSFTINISMGILVFTMTAEEFFSVGFRTYTEMLGKWFSLFS